MAERNPVREVASMLLVLAVFAAGDASGVVEFGAARPIDAGAVRDAADDVEAELATDARGTWVAVWWTYEPNENDAALGEVRLARSIDGGVSWDEPPPEDTIGVGAPHDSYPTVATDGDGLWVAAWTSWYPLGGAIGLDYDLLMARSIDGGATWSAPTPLNANAASDSGGDWRVDLANDGGLIWIAAWYSRDTLGDSIGSDRDILIARSLDGGMTWTQPVPLDPSAVSDSNSDAIVDITTDGQGTWLAVWESRPSDAGTNILAGRSLDNGASWSEPIALNREIGGNFVPRVATDGQGNWIVVWASNAPLGSGTGRDYDIAMVRSTDGGATWTEPAALNANAARDSGDDGFPTLVSDGMGKWLAVWNTNDSLGGALRGGDWDIVTAESTDGGATWTAPLALSPSAACDVGDDTDARVATDGQGEWLALWESDGSRGGVLGDDDDILFAHVEIDPMRCQTRTQQACINALNADLAKVARAQDRVIAKCAKNHARGNESAVSCLELPNSGLQRAFDKTHSDADRRCAESPPDFGPWNPDAINDAAAAAERSALSGLFGADLDAAIAVQADDPSAAKCQQAVVKSVHKCQSTQYKEFNRCKKNALKKGGATSAEDLARCLGLDPKARIAKQCDPSTGALATKILLRSCEGVDLAVAFPGCGASDPHELTSCVDEVVACQVCLGLDRADDLAEDCDLYDDGEPNASCTAP